ncbi:AAA family ATPase [Microbacterium sp.]|uniref:AAA family ATPase n=1 Tax=Microbacterium sp. TaxID=51671 RepID=UPI0028A25CB2|nr:AAA family ATPase [Microbacterium sp.]
MARVLITGMSGVGKSTVIRELTRRGAFAVDTDDLGWKDSVGDWITERMTKLLRAHDDVIVSGTVANQGEFYPSLHHVVLLTAPLDVMLGRIEARDDNPYGKSSGDRAEIIANMHSIEPLLRATATLELDATAPIGDTVDIVHDLYRQRFT